MKPASLGVTARGIYSSPLQMKGLRRGRVLGCTALIGEFALSSPQTIEICVKYRRLIGTHRAGVWCKWEARAPFFSFFFSPPPHSLSDSIWSAARSAPARHSLWFISIKQIHLPPNKQELRRNDETIAKGSRTSLPLELCLLVTFGLDGPADSHWRALTLTGPLTVFHTGRCGLVSRVKCVMNVTVSAGIDFCFSPALTPPNHTARNSESPHLLGEFRFPVIRKKKKSNHSAMIFFFYLCRFTIVAEEGWLNVQSLMWQ